MVTFTESLLEIPYMAYNLSRDLCLCSTEMGMALKRIFAPTPEFN